MVQEEIEDWLPLRGRWLGYFWRGFRALSLFLCLWSLQWMMPVTLRCACKGQVGAARAQISSFKTALELYRLDHDGKPPTRREGLLALIRPPFGSSASRWKGPYLYDVSDVPLDPWGHRYLYQSPGPAGEVYLITSYGADGRPGGSGDAEDLLSHRSLHQRPEGKP